MIPHFICLMPIWNHRHETICNAIQCFDDQTWPHKTLFMIDDRPREARFYNEGVIALGYSPLRPSTWSMRHVLLSSDTKYPTMPDKYNAALYVMRKMQWPHHVPTHVSIWDDDDGFSPRHLEIAAKAYADNPDCLWTYPDTVFSTFGGVLRTEPSGGRFWSSMTFHISCLDAWMGYFPIRKAIGQDQMFLGELRSLYGDPATPDLPTYVYRWGAEGEHHSSGIATGFTCEQWWDKSPYSVSTEPFVPKYDQYYLETIKEMQAGWPTSIAP